MPHHLHLDPFAGVAGDMFIGAMIDLGVDLEAIRAPLASLPIEPAYTLTAEPTRRSTIRGVDFKVNTVEHAHSHDHNHEHGREHGHHDHVHPADILELIDQLDAPDRARQRARATVNILAEAEAAVHGVSVDQVHFHEVGAVDSIVDMLGAALALEALGVERVTCGPLPIGHGFVRCAHGQMPLPAPATAAIMQRHKIPQRGVDRACETVTPTGAAIVAAITDDFGPMPAITIAATGYGAGDRDDPDLPNLLRACLGHPTE